MQTVLGGSTRARAALRSVPRWLAALSGRGRGGLALRDKTEIDEALARVQARKPTANPLPHLREDLVRWWRERAPPSAGGG